MSFIDSIASAAKTVVNKVVDKVEDIVKPDPPPPPEPGPTIAKDARAEKERHPSHAPLPADPGPCAPAATSGTTMPPAGASPGAAEGSTLVYTPGDSTASTMEYNPAEDGGAEGETIGYVPGAESGRVAGRPGPQVANNGRGRGAANQPPTMWA